ncbi:MAG: hypothetical protein QOJ65_2127 [Fimbriimonadaceae bacterium]|nr:hypothetical protein [Fimbriimonadaceae bacterium]
MSPRSLLPAALAALALLVAGCGGGGGGGGSSSGGAGSISYRTDWGRVAAIPTGVSQRIQLFTSSGTLVSSKIINQASSTTASFPGLAAGDYLLTAELNSGADFGGTTTGALAVVLTVAGGGVSFTSKVGDAPSSINVTPETATITAGETKQFAATPYNTSGQAVFVADNSFSWHVNGGVATVSDTGTVLGTNPGIGSVIATYDPTGLTDAAVLTVNAFVPVRTKWTVLVYMNAANDLDQFGDLNVNQMERVAGGPDVRFIVQWKQAYIPGISDSPSFLGTRRYQLKKDTTDNIASQLLQDMGMDVDMGDWVTLRDFVSWGQTNYPADRYVLVIWNHGNGWHRKTMPAPTRGVSYDDETGNSIDTWQLGAAMGANHVDIFAWDASLMQMLEVNDEIRDKAEVIVGSEESPPGAGYPYNTIFQHFTGNPDASTVTLAKKFVSETLLVPSYATQKITQSVLQANQLTGLSNAVDQLASALLQERLAARPGFDAYIQQARQNAQTYSQNSSRTYRDLVGLTQELDKTVIVSSTVTYVPSAAVKAADQAVRTAAANAILFEGHNTMSPGSNGIAIDFSPASRFANYSLDYAQLKFAQQSQWDDWLAVAP